MLLTKIVKVKWHGVNKKHYESKGYIYTKMGDEFEVKVEDLTEGSHAEVECLCDYCLEQGKKSILIKKYDTYIKQNKKSIIKKDCCKECKGLKQTESNLLIYGVKSTAQITKVKQKAKQTNLIRYGSENYLTSQEGKQKVQQTVKNKYGVDNVFQHEEIKNKIKNTNIEKYGVAYYTQTQECKDKIKQTCLEKYGTKSACQNEKIKQKSQNTSLIRYNTKNPMQNEKIKQKQKESCIRKYGVDNYAKTNEYRIKYKQTCLEKYGVESPFLVPEIRKKINETNLQRYGTIYPMQNKEVMSKFLHTLNGTQKCFTSSQQIEIYNMLKDYGYNIELNYSYSNCLLDMVIFIKENNIKINIEYDGYFWHKNNQNKDRKRDEFLKCNGFKILRIKSAHKLPSMQQLLNAIEYLKQHDKKYSQIILDDWGEKNECSISNTAV